MKSIYYQFVNFIQTMPIGWFLTLWMAMLALGLIFIVRFFKIYNGTQNSFEKVSFLVLALIFLALLIYLTYLRN